MLKAKVSVIIPAYNKASYIARAIDSVLLQKYANTEIIIVDDGSTDETPLVVERYSKYVKYLQQDKAGPGAARNRGVQESSGKYLAFLDADDYWLEGFLEHTVKFLEEHPDVDVVSTAYFKKRSNEVIRWPPVEKEPAESVISDFFLAYARSPHFCWTGSVIVRRDAFLNVGGFRTDLPTGEDIELWCCLGATTRWGYIPIPLAVYDQTVPTSLMRRPLPERKHVTYDLSHWERRVVKLLNQNNWRSYQRVRWNLLVEQIRLRIALQEYDRVKALTHIYSREFEAFKRLILIILSMCPSWSLHIGRWIYYVAKKRFGYLKESNDGKDNEDNNMRS